MRIFYIENYDFLFGDCRSFYFHSFTNQVLKKDKQVSLIKSTLHVSKGMLCLYDKQNSNTWLHVDMKFFLLVFNSTSLSLLYTKSVAVDSV